jgi:hypothetical protein
MTIGLACALCVCDTLTGGAPLEAPGLVSFLGYAVSKSTGVNQTSPLDRHHPTETLETM